MSDHALFYNSVDHDRVYNADSFSDWLKKFFTTGVFTGDLFVSALTGMNVSIGTGYVNINGKVMIYETATQLTLEPANGIYPRIDTIVVERNDTDRDFNLKVVTGDYANLNNPVPTPPVRSGAIYQLVLAQIYVGAGVTEITQANITDTRPDDDLCGIVTGTVTEMDFSQFAAQFAAYYQEFKNGYELDFTNWSTQQRAAFDAWMADEQDDFDTWFANLHYVLDGDVAGHLQNEIDALAAGMTGSIFEIQTSESTLIGKTVTVTGPTKTMTATISNAGTAEIRGFDEIGTITISATDGVDTATTIINIPYFGNYPITLAFWQAIVNIQGDENLYGEDILVSDSSHILVDTVTLDSVGQGTFYASRADTYTFTATYSGETFTKNLVVTEETTYSLSIETVPNGSTITPTDVIQTWLKCARIIDKSYTTLTEVLDDEETFDILLRDSNACDYMARSTTWSTTICADADAMARVGKYDYCSSALLGNSTWASAIHGSTYSDYVLKPLVPTMTSDTTPSGECIGEYFSALYPLYYAFDKNTSTKWYQQVGSTPSDDVHIGYHFTSPVVIRAFSFIGNLDSPYLMPTKIQLQGSHDNSTWANIGSEYNYATADADKHTEVVVNSTAYEYYRLKCSTRNYSTENYVQFTELQFYGHTNQTNIIHSAPQDTIYYMEDGDQVVLCTTDANGVGEVDWSDFDTDNITLYSSVAKDPDNLSNDYSKTIKITKSSFGGTTEAYLMPDVIRTLYWWGYNNGIVAQTAANGWSQQNTSWTLAAPTFNLNSITLSASSAQHSGIASENTILASKVMSISGARSGVDGGTGIGILGTKVWASDQIVLTSYDATNALIEVSNNTSRSGYIVIGSDNGRSRTCNALWYE